MSVTETCAAVFKIWRRLLPPTKSEANVALIGHSLDGDIDVLRNVENLADNVRILLRDDPRLRVTHLFDTQHFARGSELNFASVSLADLASSLDIAPEYRDDRGMIAGWHNASNDAAYTMLTALFMATRNPGDALISPTRSAMQHRNLPSSPSAWREWSRARQVRRRSVKLQRRKERQEKQKRREAVKAHRKQRLSSTSAWLEQKAKQKLRKADDVLREALRTLRPRTRNASSKWMQGAKWMLQGGCYITLVYVFAITSQAAVGFF
jgi:DNA polymerase III epsilon subunit-like protein